MGLLALLGQTATASLAEQPPAPAEDVFAIETWSTDRGLPQNSVNTIIQSRSGYLWLGTYNGLVRFDGVRMVVFDSGNTPAMQNSRVTSLLEDSQGTLWIGHETGELTRLIHGRFEPVPLGDSWPGGTVQGIAEDGRGDVWLLNIEGAVLRVRDGLRLPRFPGIGLEPGGAPEMVRDQHGRLLVSRNGAVAAIENDRWTPLVFDSPSAYRSRVFPARNGGLWVAGSGTVRRWDANGWVEEAGPVPPDTVFIPTMLETASGRLILGTLNRGLVIHDPDTGSSSITAANGLPQNWVKSVLEDRERNLWVGTRGGLSVLRPRKVVMRIPPDHWQNAIPLSVAPGAGGVAWAGSEGAGLYRLSGESWHRFSAEDGLANPYVWSVLEDSAGRVWAGTWGGGLFLGQNGAFAVPEELKNLTDPVTALLEHPPGTLWIGTGKGLARWTGGQLTRLASLGGAAAGDIRALTAGATGELWIGTMGAGLGRLAGTHLETFTAREGMPGDFVLTVHSETNGTLWIGTLERGICRFKNGRFAVIDSKRGLPSNAVGFIAGDEHGKLWFNSSHGIFSANLADLHRVADGAGKEPLNCLVYGVSEGLPALAGSAGFTPAGFRDGYGRLWFPTSKGLAIVNPARVATNRLPPPVVIEEVRVGGEAYSIAMPPHNSTPLEIPPGSQQVEIRFTALSYSAPEKVRFRWSLEGLDKRWADPSPQRSVTYSYLPPGRYLFRVTASNNDGVWNEQPAVLPLLVLPFYWETWWFKLGLTLIGLAGFGAVIVLVQRGRLRRKLERAAREREIERERARIAQDIHDDLGSSLTRIGMLSQTAAEHPGNAVHTNRYLDQIYATAREMTRSMDEIVWAVNPRHDTLDSLFNYLTRFAHEFLGPARIRCRFRVPVDFQDRAVRSDIRHNLFLALKEILNNVVRHADATEVQISISLEREVLTLVVDDNGRGVDSEAPATGQNGRIITGHGLANLQSRLERIAGCCRISNRADKGLRVELWVPLDPEAPPSPRPGARD